MRPLTFRTKLVLSHVGLVFALLVVVTVMLERFLAADLQAQRDERLVLQAKSSTEWASSGRHPNRVAARLAAIVQADVTIFDSEDCVIGSSRREARRVAPCEAPDEVRLARAESVGRATRAVDGDRLLFVAVPAEEGLVVRLAVSSREIDKPIAAMRARLLIAAAIAAATALVLGLGASLLAARPLRTMAAQAERIARGEYDLVLPELPRDEFGRLKDTLAALAKQLSADMDRIQRLEKTRRDFVANVTHELRTPIAAISGYAETLAGGQVSAERAAEFADMLFRQAQRLSAMVDSLLLLAELDAAPSKVVPLAPVDAVAVGRDVIETLSVRAQEIGAIIRLDTTESVTVLADAGRLEQVIENLVDNALKYGKRGGEVVIAAERQGERVLLSVSDDGPGVPEEHRARVFERFYRVDVGRSRERGGAGLGLSIVKHLVESMGGTVSIEAAPGGGARFVVELAAAGSDPP